MRCFSSQGYLLGFPRTFHLIAQRTSRRRVESGGIALGFASAMVRSSSSSTRYQNVVALAPMVRVGTLPMRLLALRYGADLVYTEEIIDHKMVQCERIENELLQTIDYVHKDGTVVFRTCAEERDKVIFQVGTADAERALKTALLVQDDVAGFDVNMGCPKSFSISGGMGAALLRKPETVKQILTTLVANVKVPVTCKIRLLPTIEESIEFAKLCASCGIAAIGIHGRFQHERPREAAHYDYMAAITKALDIPVLASGGALDYVTREDLPEFKTAVGTDSLLLARAAMWNPSIFRPEGMKAAKEVIRDYLKVALDVDNPWENAKFCVLHMLHNANDPALSSGLAACNTYDAACEIMGMGDYLRDVWARRDQGPAKRKLSGVSTEELDRLKKLKPALIVGDARYLKHEWPSDGTPKFLIDQWAHQRKIAPPACVVEEDITRRFRATIAIDGKEYMSANWEKSKKIAEQSSSIVVLNTLEIPYTKLDPLTKTRAPVQGLSASKEGGATA